MPTRPVEQGRRAVKTRVWVGASPSDEALDVECPFPIPCTQADRACQTGCTSTALQKVGHILLSATAPATDRLVLSMMWASVPASEYFFGSTRGGSSHRYLLRLHSNNPSSLLFEKQSQTRSEATIVHTKARN